MEVMSALALLFLCVVPFVPSCAPISQIQWVRTAQGTADRVTLQPPLTFGGYFEYNVTVEINRTDPWQTIVGFGGAFTDSASYVLSRLKPALQSQVLDMYFSEAGLQYNMGRLPIGSCDFSLEHYTYDDSSGDVTLSNFSITHDKERIIPFILRAMETRRNWSMDPLHIVASPWSAPGWMKANGNPYCSQCSACHLLGMYNLTWANYFSKFLSAYADEGIPVWGVTVQNEPEYCPPDYEGMCWNPEAQRDFISGSLGPTLRRDHPDVNLLIYDHNKDHVYEWAQVILTDPQAAQYIWGTAVHWYTGDQFDNLYKTHFVGENKWILATEATEVREEDPAVPSWHKGEHYAHDIIGDINNFVAGFIDWNLVLDMNGGPNHKGPDNCEGAEKCGSDAMILVDTDNQILHPQVFYYYMAHFSKYVPRGSRRIYREVYGSSDLECVAFTTPTKQVVVVVMNTSDKPVDFQLLDETDPGKPYYAIKITALPHSIQTFTYT